MTPKPIYGNVSSFATGTNVELDDDIEVRKFPEHFIWGSATSSFQIEGAHDADGKSESIWDRFCSVPGNIVDGSNGDKACGHYELYRNDVALMKDLGLSAYRFSIAWTRVLPTIGGEVNEAGIGFYDRLVDELLEAGITPFPTLYHWDLPQALEDQGGWTNRQTAYAFADYAEATVERLGDRVETWTTLNEPFVSANHGYLSGEHAPGKQSMDDYLTASHYLLLAHGLASQRIRSLAPKAKVAIVLNFTSIEPATNSPQDQAQAQTQDDLENRWYVEPISGMGYPAETAQQLGWDQSEVLEGDLQIISDPVDLLGINFYTRNVVSADDSPQTKEFGTTDMDWEIHPPSFGKLLRRLNDDYNFPALMITENGAAMPDQKRIGNQINDQDRIDYLRRHIAQVHSAIDNGVPIVGYLAWSLFDNFEWAWGYTGRFGLVEVNFETLERIPKLSADWFSSVISSNEISIPAADMTGGPLNTWPVEPIFLPNPESA